MGRLTTIRSRDWEFINEINVRGVRFFWRLAIQRDAAAATLCYLSKIF